MGGYSSKTIVKEDSEIDLAYKKLTTLPLELTQELYHYPHLRTLSVANNALPSLLGIKRLTTLQTLNLQQNNIKEFEEDLLHLVELQRLTISHNQISHIPEEIRKLRHLRELKLFFYPAYIYHLSHLTLLNLAHNQLDIFPIEISLLSNLKHLDLYANRIPYIPASAFAQCAQLTHINLSHNALRELPARLFDNLPHLVKLYASHNQVKLLPNMDRLVALRELDVSYNKLERVPNFKQRLTFIDLSHNPATASASKQKKEKPTSDEAITFNVEKGKRLFHITGHSYMVEHNWRLPDMGYYLLDNGSSLLLWEAHRCSTETKEVANSIAQEYAKEFNIRRIHHFSSDFPGDFWQQIDMQNPFSQARTPLPAKKDYYLDYVMSLKLFCFGEDTRGDVHVDLQAGKRPYHNQMDSACCYVLDSGWDVFVWAGSESSAKQRQHALLKADELMDYPRMKLSCIQWEFEGDEKTLFKAQFLNWDKPEVHVDIPVEPKSEKEKAVSSLKKRHDSFVKLPDAEFGTFPEIKIKKSAKQKFVKKPKIVVERPPTPEKARLVPELPIGKAIANRSLLGFAERPSIPKHSRAPTNNPVRDRQTRHLAHEKVSPRNPEKSPRGTYLGTEDWQKVQLKPSKSPRELPESGPRLIQFQGRRGFLGKRLQPVSASIVPGNAYLLDTGKHGASRTSKGAALALAKSLKDKERPDSAVISFDANGDDSDFWQELGGKVALPNAPVDDAESETTSRDHIYLYKVRNDREGFQLTTEASGFLKKDMLESTGCYIVDADTELYVWFGKQAPKLEKDAGLKFAEEIEKEKQGWKAPISKEFETSEQVLFKEKFIDWGGSIPISVQQVAVGVNVARIHFATRKQVKLDVNQMHALKQAKEEPMADDGSGKIKVWRVDDFEKVETSEADYGNFYMGDAYVILYTYIWKNVPRYIIYFYQGRDATINDAGAAALLTVGLDDELNRQAKEVRVVQGKEPKHFLTIFKGKITWHQGQDPLGVGKKHEGPAMYDVRGNDELSIRAIQVYPSANMLHHCHVFIVLKNRYNKEGPNFIWCGNKSNNFEKNFATNLLASQGYTNVAVISKGTENDIFWDLLDGESLYYEKNPDKRVAPRLFQCMAIDRRKRKNR